MNVAEEIKNDTLDQLLAAANTFYKNPVNRQAYEDWKKNKEAQQYENDNRT